MATSLDRIKATRRTGEEPVHANGAPLGGSLLDFWQWLASDLLANTTRGCLAEYLVAQAVGAAHNSVRSEWDAFDLETPDGVRVEVKSAAYVQSWAQRQHSTISFRVPKTRAWTADTNVFESESRRQAQVYVFALLHETEAPDPLNVLHWTFYVLPTVILDRRSRSQHSISLNSLKRESSGPVSYSTLRESIRRAALAV